MFMSSVEEHIVWPKTTQNAGFWSTIFRSPAAGWGLPLLRPLPSQPKLSGPNIFDASPPLAHVRQEFVSGLSVLSRGNLHEKLLWTFSLYDTNGDGIVTKDEMLDIVTAIYDLMGKYAEPSIDEHTARDHVERVFEVSDWPPVFT